MVSVDKYVRTVTIYVRMKLTASKLRDNIYRILDEVLETGTPAEIVRRGKKLKIVPADKTETSRLKRLKRRKGVWVGDAEDLVHIDWSSEWKP